MHHQVLLTAGSRGNSVSSVERCAGNLDRWGVLVAFLVYDHGQRLTVRKRFGHFGAVGTVSAAISCEVQVHLVRWQISCVGVKFEMRTTRVRKTA